MEDATVTQDGLYQQGRFPSIIDTDDLVFELGKQTVNRLNEEKLLDTILKKSKMLEDALREAVEAKAVAEKAVADIRNSNEQYIENNRKMDAALVEARNELAAQKAEASQNLNAQKTEAIEDLNIQKAEAAQRMQDVIDEQKELTNKSEATISELRAEISELSDALKAAEEKPSKKRSLKKLLKK